MTPATDAAREALEVVRVLICEATDPRSRDPLLKQAVSKIDATLALTEAASQPREGDWEKHPAFSGHKRMDWATLNGPWRNGGWGDEVVANRTTVMRFIGTIDALLAALTQRPPEQAGAVPAGEVEQLRHKLWMIACHATGGGIPNIEGIDRSVNDICVQITAARNAVYEAGKASAAPTPPDAGPGEMPAGMVETGRVGCIGIMDPKRATYFLERFKREEKWLGPHEQWALDYTIAVLAAPTPSEAVTIERCKQALQAEQDRLDKDPGDYLMDTNDCINVLSELLATPKAPPQTPPDAGPGEVETQNYETAWRALSEPLSWMHDSLTLKAYWGWNLADIANDLIDRAYPGMRPSSSPAASGEIPAGMVAWHGGDSAPADWDGGKVLYANRAMARPLDDGDWQRPADIPLIAYTPKAPPQTPPDAGIGSDGAGDVERLRMALSIASQRFEAIRRAMVNDLEEPGRTAFWSAVQGRKDVDAALATQPGDGGRS